MKYGKTIYRLRLVVALAFFLANILLFTLCGQALSFLAAWQFGPELANFTALLTAGLIWNAFFAAVVLGMILLGTFLFGRFYCSIVCPFGFLQELILLAAGIFKKRTERTRPDHPFLRVPLLLFLLGALCCGWLFPLRFLEPFANFGMFASGLVAPTVTWVNNFLFPGQPMPERPDWAAGALVALIPFVFILCSTLFFARIFCTAICPVGALFHPVARRGCFTLSIRRQQCRNCQSCSRHCPAGCIDLTAYTIDNGRCLRCWRCVAVCKFDAIVYTGKKPSPIPVTAPNDRRKFILTALTATAGGVVCSQIPAVRRPKNTPEQAVILPPGAGSAQRFADRCTGCQLCIANCKGNVLSPAGLSHGFLKHAQPYVSFDSGMCEFNCQTCSSVCPNGALQKMSLPEKRLCRIGLARYEKELCVAYLTGDGCGACAEHCPTGALRMKEDERGILIPQLTEELCIGCGSCEYACPVRPVRSIRVEAVSIQVRATDPQTFFAAQQPPPPSGDNNDWAF